MLRALLPSFVANAMWPEKCNCNRPHCNCKRHQPKLHSTSYLDGLRGIASFIVFFCHYTEKRHGYFLPAYKTGRATCDEDGRYVPASSFLQLPIIRVLYSGRPMVHIFFIISGFALAYKPLHLLHSHPDNLAKFYEALTSSVFRRPIRLFLPCAISTLIVAILCQTGHLYQADETWGGQLRSWAGQYFGRIAWPWAWDYDLRPGYNIHLWTIPIEFSHAMFLFLVILALSRLRSWLRFFGSQILAAYCLACGKWAACEFLQGFIMAENHIERQLSTEGPILHDMIGFLNLSRTARRRTLAVCHVLNVARHSVGMTTFLLIAGWPNADAATTAGTRELLKSTPSWFLNNAGSDTIRGIEPANDENVVDQKFWFAMTAFLLVEACGDLDGLRRLFERPVAQYCGRISYAMYLVHGPALDYFQDMVLGRPAVIPTKEDKFLSPRPGSGIKGLIGVETATQRTLTWFLGLLVLGFIIVWIADLFWRFVDAPIVKLGRLVERACCNPRTERDDTRDSKQHQIEEEVELSVVVY